MSIRSIIISLVIFAAMIFAGSIFSTPKVFAAGVTGSASGSIGGSSTGTAGTTSTPNVTGSATGTVTPTTSVGDAKIGVGVGIPGTDIGSGGNYSFADYIRAIYSFAMKAAVVLATLMVIYAGYKYLTSRGETGAINEAKDMLFSTLMGAALLMLVVLVANIAGINTTLWNSASTGAQSTQVATPPAK